MSASATIEVRAPSEQSEGTRAQLLRWLKSVGETVAENEPLIEVETDKVTIEIASPAAGTLCEILKREQESIDPGEVLARIDVATGASEAAPVITPTVAAAQAPTATGGWASHILASHEEDARRPRRGPADHISPAVRRLMQRHQLSVNAVRATGIGGAITVDDVLRAAADRVSDESAAISLTRSEPAELTGRRVAHSATRRHIAEHMVRSLLHTAPHVTTVFEADLSAILHHRTRHREDFQQRGAPLTLTAYVLAACVGAIRAVPEVNARWHEDALEFFEHINIGVATAIESKGLVVPVLRAVQSLDLFAIASGLARLVAAAREDRLRPEDVRGGTFTVSNHGVSGSLVAAPIVINQPQVAILGVGKLEKRPVVIHQGDENHVLVRPRCYITLTIDHRAMDGDRANQFLRVLIERLEGWDP